MSDARAMMEAAFARLSARDGYVDRPNQRQLAWLVSDCLDEAASGAFEAPTGLGKSLAALIPAIAHAIATGKRTVVATYTNVLAEQYWRKDLPLALSLFDLDEPPTVAFLIGRQRYACLAEMEQADFPWFPAYRSRAEMGLESEFRAMRLLPGGEATGVWRRVAAPPICPRRLCPHYAACYYYKARREAEKATVVITNHSVVMQDAMLKKVTDGEQTMLGEYDALIVDEAHDFAQAATNSLEFELSDSRLGILLGLAARIDGAIAPLAARTPDRRRWDMAYGELRRDIERVRRDVTALATVPSGILAASPDDIAESPPIKRSRSEAPRALIERLTEDAADSINDFVRKVGETLADWRETDALPASQIREATEAMNAYGAYLREFAIGCREIFRPEGVAVSYVGHPTSGPIVRRDVVDLREPLTDLLWSKTPGVVFLSATLAVDGAFDFFVKQTGARAHFTEVLETPFDYASQCAVYLSPAGRIPDPSVARKENREDAYYEALASEIEMILEAMEGRSLVLFHSRREMEETFRRISPHRDYPVYLQRSTGVASVGERFREVVPSSLFAVRSFWTGFDAPGETLSCVVLVRVPFEVPVDPPQVARQAWLQSLGESPFATHTLPQAKMMMRQGAGRLIRRAEDRGVLALLDPRLRTKGYGEEILANLPRGMRTFADVYDAMAWVGLEPSLIGDA
ncbi:MAG: ATP-dependent DNA helicase [Fimbriimonadaceae bacterium]|nr:ATP-dependent DNA helicase [Fimbriimonadaceae bacterium]